MAGRPPISIKVLQANGMKHLTKAEIREKNLYGRKYKACYQ